MTVDESLQALIKDFELDAVTEENFWKKILDFFKQLKSPFDENDTSTQIKKDYKPLLADIQALCDLIDEESEEEDIPLLHSKIYQVITADDSNITYWNESLQWLIDFCKKKLGDIDDDTVLLEEAGITLDSLKKADAGYGYTSESDWVMPDKNQDGEKYQSLTEQSVRHPDAVLLDLQDDKKLQETREKALEWIRLLMPQYGRRVKIEDLDRNFWVIAQSISAISNRLFGADAPLPEIFKGIIREITEQWENVLYLWSMIAAATQKMNENIKIISVPLSGSQVPKCRGDKRFDNINYYCDNWIQVKEVNISNINTYDIQLKDGKSWDDFCEKIKDDLSIYVDQYNQSNLVMIPCIRIDNYKHNYYRGEYYPGIFFHRQNGEWEVYKFVEEIKVSTDYSQYVSILISPKYECSIVNDDIESFRFTNSLYGLNLTDQGRYIWTYPYKNTNEIIANSSIKMLYGALRSEIIQNIKFNGNLEFEAESIKIHVHDAGLEFLNSRQGSVVGTYKLNTYEEKTGELIFNFSGFTPAPPDKKYHNRVNYGLYSQDNDNASYYLGELASDRKKTVQESITENIFHDNAYVVRIGGYLPLKNNGKITDNQFKMSYLRKDAASINYSSYYGSLTSGAYNPSDEVSTKGEYKGEYTDDTTSHISKNVYYCRYPWEYYNGDDDGITPQVPIYTIAGVTKARNHMPLGYHCFNQTVDGEKVYVNPEPKDPSYLIDDNLRYDGLVAAKKLIEYDKDKQTNPCYIATLIGLGAWSSTNAQGGDSNVYWDVGGICHLFLYIPHPSTLIREEVYSHKCDTSEYEEEYNRIPALTLSRTGTADTVKGVIEVNGTEIGKIVYAIKVNRHDAYFSHFNLTLEDQDPYTGTHHWRSLFIRNDSEDEPANSCARVVTNDGIDEENKTVRYTNVKFSNFFRGYIEYYDVEYMKLYNSDKEESEKVTIPSEICKVSQAKVEIRDKEDGYKQIQTGHILACKDGKTFETRIAEGGNLAIDPKEHTGLLEYYHKDTKEYEVKIMGEKSIPKKDDSPTVSYYYGGSYITGTSPKEQYKIGFIGK